jgi:hypothetical protein
VAQQLKRQVAVDDVYAAAPTAASARLLLVIAQRRRWPVALGDVSTAFLHARIPEGDPVIIRPPPNLRKPGKLWKLVRALYGLRSSPRLFQEHFAKVLAKLKWTRCTADAQLFRHECGALMMIHADDILMTAPPNMLEKLQADISKHMKLKWGAKISAKWTSYLGKEWRMEDDGHLAVRIPDHYYDDILNLGGMQGCRTTTTPCEKVVPGDAEPLSADDARVYRTLVGKCIWMGPDRPDLAFAIKELARHVAQPTMADFLAMKKLLRYLQGTRAAYLELIGELGAHDEITAYADADWASNSCDRRSTSGGVVLVGGALVQSWSRTQPSVALSTCEAELLAMGMAASEAKFIQSILRELLPGEQHKIVLYTDASSAKQVAYRRGLGRLKHVDTRHLWLQDEVREGRLEIRKVLTELNPADIFTKPLPGPRLHDLAGKLGVQW